MSAHPGHSRTVALAVAGLNLASKCLAVVKTIIIAALFGASSELDAFWVAYTLPTLLPELLTTVVTIVFVPRFVASLHSGSGTQAWRGVNTLFTAVLVLVAGMVTVIALDTRAIVAALAPGLEPGTLADAVRFTHWMIPAMALLGINAILSAICIAHERMLAPTLAGLVTNVCVIASALLLVPSAGVQALIVGVVAGFAVQCAILLWSTRDVLAESVRPALALRHPDFVGPMGHALPVMVGTIGASFTTLANQYFLSHLDPGAISVITFATMIAFLPVEVFTGAVLMAYYPSLGRCFARADLAGAATVFRDGHRFALLMTLPAAALLALLAEPLTVLLLKRGRFDAHDAELTSNALALLAPGIAFRSMAFYNYRVLHAAVRPWTQVAIGLAGAATTIGLNAAWIDRLGVSGVALATTVSMAQSALISYFVVTRMLRGQVGWRPLREFGVVVAVALATAVGTWLARAVLGSAIDALPDAAGAVLELAAGAAGLGVAVAVGLVLKQPDVLTLVSRVRQRWTTRTHERTG
jgi:putative peptidoglycan lipid II flippase